MSYYPHSVLKWSRVIEYPVVIGLGLRYERETSLLPVYYYLNVFM